MAPRASTHAAKPRPRDLEFASDRFKVRVRATLAEHLRQLFIRYWDREVFAPIVGRYSDDGTTAICTQILAHQPGQRFEVEVDEREAAGISRALAALWEETGGEVYYLGDWHTHPGGTGAASETDVATALARTKDPKTRCPQLVELIYGEDGLRCYIATALGEFLELPAIVSEAA